MKVDFNKLKDDDIIAYNLVKASWLQKAVRRCDVNKAVSIANIYLKENQHKALDRKIKVFAAEDIGLGSPWTFLILDKIESPLEKIELLARSPKNRETDRFLLATRDSFDKLITNNETAKEVKPFAKLLDIAETWYLKKNKKNLTNLENAFQVLQDNCSDKNTKDLINILLKEYIPLSKDKAFGCRTLLALAFLASSRNIKFKIPKLPSKFTGKIIDLKYVDDYALDKHTSFGKKLNRGIEHWIKVGSVVMPEKKYNSLYLKNGEEKYPYKLISKNKLKTTNCNITKDSNFDIYCGRGKGAKNNPLNCELEEYGWLGNPVTKNKPCPICQNIHKNNGDTLDCYETYLKERLQDSDFKNKFLKLKGKKLGCFCKPNSCHTDIMIKYLDGNRSLN